MTNIKLVIEYDGTNYHGWQSQVNANTVQDTLASAIYRGTGENPTFIGSGRTDAGVHAMGQTVNFHTCSDIPADKFKYVINPFLPKDIYILNSTEVPDDFHAQYSALKKEYVYKIHNSPLRSVFQKNYAYWIGMPLAFDNMAYACKDFLGMHDFTAFCATGSKVKDFTRIVYRSELKKDGDFIIYTVQGNGFLYNMVRIMIGTLIEIGQGKMPKDAIPEILKGKDRRKAGRTVPPQGLYLKQVFYE
ncbi:MAG TPA: tRNA pseudouridine(38-40) synthase TruA [Clostridiales bacterium]|nr:tRNA pseudouridine(38-40) synthase TruA [Clostridiales bacterium]